VEEKNIRTMGAVQKLHLEWRIDSTYSTPKNMTIGLTLGFATVAAAWKIMLGIEDEVPTMQKN